MSTLITHTRADVTDLARLSEQFLALLRQSKGPSERLPEFKAWLVQLQGLTQDHLDVADGIALQEGLLVFQEFFGSRGGSLTQVTLLGAATAISAALGNLLKAATFKPTEVSDTSFGAFLRASEYEDGQLGMGTSIELAQVAGRAKMELALARRCLARLLDEDLGSQMPDDGLDDFLIDQEAVAFCLDELARQPERASPMTLIPLIIAFAGRLPHDYKEIINGVVGKHLMAVAQIMLPPGEIRLTLSPARFVGRVNLEEAAKAIAAELPDALRHSRIDQPIQVRSGDHYTATQVGAMGPGASVGAISLSQHIGDNTQGTDLASVAEALERIRVALRGKPPTIDGDLAIGQVASAEQAARSGDKSKVITILKQAGSFVLDAAKSLGADVVVKLIETQVGG